MKNIITKIKWWEVLIIYLILYFIFRYITFFPVLQMTDEKPLIFKNFVIYNYLLNSSLLILKIFSFSMFIAIGNALWAIKSKYSHALKAIMIGQFIYLFKYIALIGYTFLLADKFNFSTIINQFGLKLSLLIKHISNGLLYSILNSISVYDLLFITITSYVFSQLNGIKYGKSLKIIASVLLPGYIIYPLIFAFLKTN